MIILLTTAGLLGALAPADELSPLHPADAVLYLEVPDLPGLLDAYEESAYAKLLTDSEFQAAIGRVIGQESFDPWSALMDVIITAEEEGDLPPLRELFAPTTRFAVSINARDGDALGFIERVQALDARGAPDADYEGMVAADLGLQLTLDFVNEAAADEMVEFLITTLRGEGAELESSAFSLGGRPGEIWNLPAGLDRLSDTLRLVQDGPRLVALVGNVTPAGLRERAERTQAGSARFAAGRELFGAPAGVTVFELDNQVSDQLMALAPDPAISPLLDVAEGLVGPNLTMLTRGGHWRVQLRDGRFVTEGLHQLPSHSPLDGLLASKPLSADALTLIHPDAIVAWAVHLDKDRALALLNEAISGPAGDPYIELEAEYGFRPDRDLIAPLGDAITYSLPGEISLLSAPPLMISVALTDAAAFRRGMAGMKRVADAEGMDEMSLSSRVYRGYEIYTLTFEMDLGLEDLPVDPLAIVRPSLVVLDDRLLITTNPTHVKKEIRRLLQDEGTLHPSLAAGAIPAGATEVGFADWIQVVGKLYSGAKSMAPMLGALAGGELPFDLAELPDEQIFTRHFGTSERWKRMTEHGMLHRAESSFGPEVVFGLIAGVAAVLADGGEVAPQPMPVQGGGDR